MSIEETSNGGIFGRFFGWWLDELAGMFVPSPARKGAWRIVAFNTTDGIDISVRGRTGLSHAGILTPEGPHARPLVRQLRRAGRGPIVLRFSPDTVLTKTLTFPTAAGDVLEPVIENQVERVAPWPAAQTRFGYHLKRETGDKLEVEVLMTSRTLIEDAMSRLKSVGVVPDRIELGGNATDLHGVTITGDTRDVRAGARRKIGWMLALLAITSLLVGALGTVRTTERYKVLDLLNKRSELARKTANQAFRLGASNAELRRRRIRLLLRKGKQPAASVMIEALARAIPDTAWLTRLEITGQEARLSGRAANAAQLISALEGSPHFARAEFAAPTTRRPPSDIELFSITVQAVPGAALEK